ncbi:MAG: tetratricopeptide repeat protein [Akkermansiaceae bacterium]|nr:tetratricopeptide repeat protein [Akkermansiaceae bacterium]
MSTIQQIALALAVAGACPALAQDGAGAARRAAARMEEQAQASMLLLNQARQQYSEGKYQEALELYRKSLNTLPKAPNMEARRRFLETSIADASVAVSQEYIKVGRYDEASELLESALKTTPNHALAKRTLELLKDPIRTNPALTPQHAVDVEKVNGLLRLAFGYYELGQYDQALKEFNSVLLIDPYNTAARRGMEQVNRARAGYFSSARDETRGNALAEVSGLWERRSSVTEVPEEPESFSQPLENPVVSVDRKLGMIRLPRVQLEQATVEEAVDYLRNQSRVHDETAQTEAERGINISLDPGSPDSVTAKDIAAKKITLNLQNVPLREALQYVARASGLIFRTNAYGAELVTPSAGTSYMVSKTIPVPPGFFSGTDSSSGSDDLDPFASGDSGSSGMTLRRVDPQKMLAAMGLKLPAGSSVKYNAGNSTLFFHGTPRDLNFLEELVAAKSAAQPLQVIVSATFLEVNQSDLEELGFNWIVNLNLDPNKWFMGGAGTDKNNYNNTILDSAARVAGAASPAGVVGGLRSGNQVFTEDSIDGMIERGTSARSSDAVYTPGGAPSILTMRGMWSQADVTMIMRGLSQKKGTDIMQHPSVVVRPGEKATFFSGRELIYPTEYDPPEIPNSTGRDYNNDDYWGDDDDVGERIPIMPMTPAHPTAFETRQLGTVFNVEVTGISEDKSMVDLTVAPEIVDFDGFINYGTPIFLPLVSQEKGKDEVTMTKASDNFILQPVFSRRSMTSSVRVITGNTLVIGALKKATSVQYEDKIPILGDIPWVGRLFRSQGSKEQRKAIIIMVKAEVVDPGGKELYTPNTPVPETPGGGAGLPALSAVE